jgi:CelD/BcsL family acetyltransferase involved in cellulose biosynthesis
MRIEVIAAHELGCDQRRLWSRLAHEQGLDSPFVSPEWLEALQRAGGPDAERVRVAVFEGPGGGAGFLPVRRGRLISRDPGAPLCDHQALISSPNLEVDLRSVLPALRTGRLDFSGAPAASKPFQPHAFGGERSHLIDVRAGWPAYQADRVRAGSKVLSEAAKKRAKLEREKGAVVFTPGAADGAAFDQLILWKRRQYRRTGQTDPFAFGWPLRLLQTLLASNEPGCSGELHTLKVGGRLAGVHYALRSRQTRHAWFIAHDPAFAAYSPGLLLLVEVIRQAAEAGLNEVDLGAGAYRFKTRLATGGRDLLYGVVGAGAVSSLSRRTAFQLRRAAEALPLGPLSALPGKAMRRLDRMTALR